MLKLIIGTWNYVYGSSKYYKVYSVKMNLKNHHKDSPHLINKKSAWNIKSQKKSITFSIWKNLYFIQKLSLKILIYTTTFVLQIFVLQNTWNAYSKTLKPINTLVSIVGGHKISGNGQSILTGNLDRDGAFFLCQRRTIF